jgi:hypothetical protein
MNIFQEDCQDRDGWLVDIVDAEENSLVIIMTITINTINEHLRVITPCPHYI